MFFAMLMGMANPIPTLPPDGEKMAALGALAQRFRYAAVDAREIPFAAQSFDGVIANHMLYHVQNRTQALEEIRRVLLPGGVLAQGRLFDTLALSEGSSAVVLGDIDEVTLEDTLAELVEKYRKSASKLAAWLENAIPEGLTVFQAPENHRRRLRTTNMCENLNLQIKRRTRVASLFPNEASLLRLVSAILMETSEEWETSRKYLTLEYDQLPN